MDRAEILDDCLNRMREGATAEECLAQYPAYADELAPMLAAAGRMTALHTATIPEARRARAKAALRHALAQDGAASRASRVSALGWLLGPTWSSRARVMALVSSLVVVILLAVMATAVVASEPGDLQYGVRLLVEQVPTWFHPSAQARAEADLAMAERRLIDLQVYLAQTGKVDTRALQALLDADAAVMRESAGLPPDQRERIAAAVQEHARTLRALAAQSRASTVSSALQRAADEVGGPAAAETPTASPTPLPAAPSSRLETPAPQVVSISPETPVAEDDDPVPALATPAPRPPALGQDMSEEPEPETRKGRAGPPKPAVPVRPDAETRERPENSRASREPAEIHPERPGQNKDHSAPPPAAGKPEQKPGHSRGSGGGQKEPPSLSAQQPKAAATREKH